MGDFFENLCRMCPKNIKIIGISVYFDRINIDIRVKILWHRKTNQSCISLSFFESPHQFK